MLLNINDKVELLVSYFDPTEYHGLDWFPRKGDTGTVLEMEAMNDAEGAFSHWLLEIAVDGDPEEDGYNSTWTYADDEVRKIEA